MLLVCEYMKLIISSCFEFEADTPCLLMKPSFLSL